MLDCDWSSDVCSSDLLLELARQLTSTGNETSQQENEEHGKADFTELFQQVRSDTTPVVVERVVGHIDEIVRLVRLPGWQTTAAGEREVKKALRKKPNSNKMSSSSSAPAATSGSITDLIASIMETLIHIQKRSTRSVPSYRTSGRLFFNDFVERRLGYALTMPVNGETLCESSRGSSCTGVDLYAHDRDGIPVPFVGHRRPWPSWEDATHGSC
jgi:hypothetical protein